MSPVDLLESEMFASEAAPISYPGVTFEDEVAEPCFTTFGKLVQRARVVGQAYEKHRCLGISLDTPQDGPGLGADEESTVATSPAVLAPASGPKSKHNHVGGGNKNQFEATGREVQAGGTEPSQVWIFVHKCVAGCDMCCCLFSVNGY